MSVWNKQKTGDSVFKPEREKEMYEKFKDNKAYVSFLKKIVQLSRKKQYEILFLNNEESNQRYDTFIGKEIKENALHLTLRVDKTGIHGLDIKSIISIVSDTSLEIIKLDADNENEIIHAELYVPDDEQSQHEAYILKTMLDKETI